MLQRAPGPILLLALAYGLLGWLSLKVAIPPDYVSLVFLPAGPAVAVALLMSGSPGSERWDQWERGAPGG